IVPVEVAQKKGPALVVDQDEEPGRGNVAKLPSLRTAFAKEGTITAGNASSINDGAAALVVMSAERAGALGVTPIARIVGHSTYAHQPEWFTTAPAGAIKALLSRTGQRVEDVDQWEVNEAFAVVALANQDELGLPEDRVNVRGGAIALGHPIGCSGARILTTLLHTLKHRDERRGVASLCIGGGEGIALMVERQ